jgi:hypothetical protein
MIEDAGEAAAAPFEIGEDAISPLGGQRIEALFEEAFVAHLAQFASRYGLRSAPKGIYSSSQRSSKR